MNSTEVMLAISEIEKESSKTVKLELLKKYMPDPTFSNVINAALNPFITYGQKPARGALAGDDVFDDTTWTLLANLKDRVLTGTAAKNAINAQYGVLEPLSAELLWRIINKDLKAGFSESSVNKVRKDFIPEFPYMRCSLPKDVDLGNWKWEIGIISQLKADGMYVNVNIEGSIMPSITSRAGQPFPEEGFKGLLNQLCMLMPEGEVFKDGVQVHGELLVYQNGVVLAREIGNGHINRLVKSGTLPEGLTIKAVLWDMIPKNSAVKKGEYKEAYLYRLRRLNDMIGKLSLLVGVEPLIELIETRVVKSYDSAMEHYKDARRRKLEGTIVKNPKGIWRDGTSKDQVKLKEEVPVELEVEGFEEGKPGSKTESTFGSLRCKSKDGLLKTNVGSGFTDAMREAINANREDWIGAIITVKSNDIMYAKRGKITHSLFLPIFIERRHDKSEADTFQQIVDQFESKVEA